MYRVLLATMERHVFEQQSSEEALTQHSVFAHFKGDTVAVVVWFHICPCFILRLQIRGQLFLNILSCVLISEEKKKEKVIFQIAYQPEATKVWRSFKEVEHAKKKKKGQI